MTTQKRCTHPHAARATRSEPFKDEVYRHMYRLEASRPGAAMDLALALLRAWQSADLNSKHREAHLWLKKISPICLAMIEDAMQSGATSQSSPA